MPCHMDCRFDLVFFSKIYNFKRAFKLGVEHVLSAHPEAQSQ